MKFAFYLCELEKKRNSVYIYRSPLLLSLNIFTSRVRPSGLTPFFYSKYDIVESESLKFS